MGKRFSVAAMVVIAMVIMVPTVASADSTVVKGHQGKTGLVNGKYTEVQVIGDSVCTYQVQYRGDFGGDPYLDNGWIINNVNCAGGEYAGAFNYVIVHKTDPRYRDNPDWSIWGDWEYHVLTESGSGNLVRPENHIGN